MKINSDLFILLSVFLIGTCLYIPIGAYSDASFYVGTQDTRPTGVAFSTDGSKMFVSGNANKNVFEYALSVPFNVTSSIFVDSVSVGSLSASIEDVTFSTNGTKMFISNPSSNIIYGYTLSVPFNVTSSTLTESPSISNLGSLSGISFSTNGTKMFTIVPSAIIREYALSVPFNVTSSIFVNSISVSSQDTFPQGIAFSTSGSKMFVLGNANDKVFEYSLSTPFVVNSSTFTDSFNVGSQDDIPKGIAFSTNGTKMFIAGSRNDAVYEYTLPAPFDLVDTASPTFTAKSYSFTQTTVTFSERVNGTLIFSDWSFDGNVPTTVSEHSDGNTLSDVTFLVFTHNTTNDQTPNVAYTGNSLTDSFSNGVTIGTVTAVDGIPLFITNITSDAAAFGTLKVGDTITFTLTPGSTENGATINGTYNSVPLFWNSIDNGATFVATYTISEGDTDHTTPLQITNVTITDSAGNPSLPFNGTDILKRIDANSPVITLNGTNPQTIEQGAGYTELNAITNDGSAITINSANFTDAVGTYTIYYDSTDTAGNNAIQVNRTVNVVDTTPPVITLDGLNPQTIELGDGYTELNATTNDGSTITINSANFTDAVGTYTIYYDSTDTAGNTAIQVNRTVNVVDTTPPVITLDGLNPQTIELGDGYTELNATTNDGSTITINSANFTDAVGTYTIYYDSTDTAGNNAIQVNRTVNVVDTTPPVITLDGLNPQTIELGDGYTELNATTNDGSTITINSANFTDAVGTYTIYYDSTDTAGNTAIQVNRTVNVVDTTPPVITLDGLNPQTIELGDGYTELNATTNDGSTITINSANFTDAVGTYTIYYDSTDTAGNNAIQVNRTVNVVDTTPPVITLDGLNPQTIELGDGYTELNATTNDGSTITINSANFTDAVGTYHIYYDSTDTAGNTAIQVNRTVNVVDTTPPVITLDGLNPQTIELGDGYTELNATTNDGSTITINSANFTDAVGTYTIYYDSTDTAGNTAIQVNRTVNVVDTTPPVITLDGLNPQTIELGDGYTELNATTNDGSTITINSANFTDAVGTYHIYYDSTDTAGNNAIQVNRTVNVVDTTPPVITLDGLNPQTIELGDGYTELNATTNDGSTITINSANFTDAVGTYHIYYDSTDTAGNNAIQVNRTVNVVDTTPPVITLDGLNPQTIELGDGYTELNATTNDGSAITINSANFTDAVGTYHIYYDSTDTAGNNAIQVNRTVNVVDTTPPVITLDGLNPQTIELGDGYTELNATTNDGSAITINSANFTDAVGTYHIYYDSTDTAGNNAIQVNRTVNVVDTTPPVITLDGLNPQTIELGDGYTELNATTNDGSAITINSANFTDAVGTYHIYYDSTDTAGNNAIQVNRTVNVVDTTPPVITLDGLNPQTIELGDGYTELNATTNDGSAITINSANFTDAVGTYHIYYDSTDTAGNTAIQVNRTVNVVDTTPPVITLDGLNPQTIELGDGYTELNATTNDGSTITINSANFTDAVGTYHIYYDSTDTAGNNAIQVNRTVNVVDTTPPVITLDGLNPQTIELGDGYTELNATTNDGSTITINSANFTDAVGTYTIYYDSTDTAGNNAIQVNRTVNVVDTTPPTLSSAVLNEGTGIFTVTFSEIINASSINSTGFSIRDNNNNTSTGAVTLSTLELTTTANAATISFNMTLTNRQSVIAFNVSVLDISTGAVQDINGNAITLSVNNTITTTSDSIPPVISLIGDNPQTIEQGAGYTELGATTSDDSLVTINITEFADVVGTYSIYYDSIDTAGNTAIQVNRTVNVVDTTPPTLSSAVLNEGTGIFTVTFSEIINASSINSTGFSIRDNNNNTSTGAVTLSTLELTTTANAATISFNMTLTNRQSVIAFNVSVLDISTGAVQDINGNAITLSVNNTITTTSDSIPPVISLIGDNPQTIEQGAGYTELNATTNDGSTITINSANFTDAVGNYTIYYDSTDTAGNNAIQVNRTVNVVDTTPPTLSSAVLNEGTGIFTVTFSEIINASSINSTGFSIRDNNNNTSTGAVTLSTLELTTTANAATISFNMTLTNRQSVIAFNVSVLDISTGAVQDINGNAITLSANNTITTTSDSIPPVISLIGDNPQTIEQGAGYTELNATTNDGSTITINSANFTDAVGNYTIYYDSTDTAGNNAIQVNRTVNVVDTTPPTLSSAVLNEGTGIFTVTFSEIINASSINSTGFSIRDNNNTSTGAVTLSTLELTTTANAATISFNMTLTNRQSVIAFNVSVLDISTGAVQDINGNAITLSVNNTITTTSDSIPPVISLIGDNPQTIEQGAGYTELNATTNDGSTITINSANFTDAVGNYTIYYDSTDTAGNNAIQVNRTVNVVDTTPPTLSSAVLNEGTGIFTVTFSEIINASSINSAGFSIRDNNTSTGAVTLSTLELTTTANAATISFNMTLTNRQSVIAFNVSVLDISTGAVQDINGNAITLSANNTITTTSDSIPPVISLIGDNPQTIEQGAGYTELGATTSDDSLVTINITEFADVVGTYSIYYDSIDTAGNNAIQVNRTVNVVDTTPPTLSSAVLNEGTGIFTVTFSEIINASSINSAGFSIRDNNNTSTGAVTLSTLELTTTANAATISFNMTLTNRQSVIAFNVSVLDISTGAVQDINGNAITLSANNTITTTSDSIPPVISLIGDNPQIIEQGAGYTELNATTNDGSTITINSANFTDAVGNYTIYYDSTDTAGNNAIQVNRTVNVVDTTPPTLSSAVLNEGTGIFTVTFSEIINASTINSAGFFIRDNNTSTGAVTLSTLELTTTANAATISFNMTLTNRQSVIAFNVSVLDISTGAVQDINGNAITLSVNNTITTTSDSIPPVISLIGDNPQTIEQGAGYTELGTTTSDDSLVTINITEFADVVGTYSIYYDSIDTAGNTAIQVNRTVNVVDTTPPTLSSAVLNEGTGIFTVTFSEIINASSINSTGFSIRDNNTSTGAVTLSTLELTTTANAATISFNMTLTNRQSIIAFNVSVLDISTGAVRDIFDNAITLSANNTITTPLDTPPPVISLIGDNPQTIEQGAGYTELGATTSDDSLVTINITEFADVVGTYSIYYDSIDTAGNTAIQVNRTVNVVDTTPPTLSSAVLNEGTGIFTVTFSEIINASSINSTGFSIRDNNTSTGAVTLSTLELTTTANAATISFNMTLTNRQSIIAFNVSVLDISTGAVQDINGNAITLSANNTITTTSDSIPPVISLIGDNPQTIEQGAGYTELGATTSDDSLVTINITEFADVVGTYSIYYDSIDTAGNTAIQVNRTVNVVDTTPPTLSSAVLNEGTGIFTVTFSEIINASSINSTGFSIRDNNNTSTGAVTLSTLELTTTANAATISFNMTLTNRQSVIAFNVSVLDIGAGAVQDINGNAITLSANNTITTTSDSIPPVISLIGDNPQIIEQGAGYTELNATTNDGSTITINSANFTDAVGNYTIYYDSTDTAGNNAIQVNRTVNVVDTTPPTLSSAVLNEGTGIFTVTFSEIINASTINSAGFFIRDNNTSTGAVTLSTLELTTTANAATISFNMTLTNRQSVIAFNVSVLDISTGAVQDINGNAITLSVNNTITTTSDSIPPVISLIGDNPQTIEQGAGYTELGTTTSDDSLVTINITEFADVVGTYSIYYDSIDTAGNTAIQVNRTVNVVDTTPPTLSSAVLNEGTGIFTVTFSEIINASSINSTGFSIRDNNTSTGAVTLSTLELTTTANAATISFNMTLTNRQSIIAFNVSVLDISTGAVRDIFDNAITLSANNTITTPLDTPPPVISLIGDNPQTIEQGAGYTELGATTSDDSLVTINITEFADVVGTYSIYYDSIDTAGNTAIQVNRTVNVVDTTPPTLSSAVLNEGTGIFTVTFSEIINASSINSTGFSIRDNNTSTGAVTLSTLELTTTANAATISFNMTLTNRQSIIAFNVSVLDISTGAVQDINGNAITLSANNTITTTSDSIPPVISLIGDNPQTIEQGAGYTELGATTSDDSLVTINITEFADVVGTYSIYYDSIDTAGNTAIQVNRTVNVVDTTPPTLSSAVLNEGTGIFTVTFSEIINASSINSTGFSIRDNNTSTGAVTLSTLELTTTANAATISFNMTLTNRQSVIAFNVSVLDIGAGAVQDINGNAITLSANNTITTTSDSIPPVISLIGDNPQTIEQGAGYTELGATTSDDSLVTINITEFADVVGTYSIYYDSIDTAGNTAIQVNRTVIVSDTTPPVITLNGANSQTIELGDDYTELGATTNDGSPVTINSVNFTDIVGTYTIYYDSVDASGNNAIQVNRTVIVSDTTPPDSCVIPDSGDWIITNSCTLDASADAPGSVIVQNGSVLNIPSGITLDIDLTTFNLTVQSGGGVLIKSGGTLT